jgi:hypothetical protein
MGVKCFFIEQSTKVRRYLRRHASDWDYSVTPAVNRLPCPLGSGHEVLAPLGEIEVAVPLSYETDERMTSGDLFPHDDARWPRACACGYEFKEVDMWQLSVDRLYRRIDTSEEMRLHEFPPGAMWFADWMLVEGTDHYRGPDGHCLVARLPDRSDWCVDGRANNCDSPCTNCRAAYNAHTFKAGTCMKYEDARPHKCWIRHGDPRTGVVTVDKDGVTCNAGAGSIATSKWHGFLRGGMLVE